MTTFSGDVDLTPREAALYVMSGGTKWRALPAGINSVTMLEYLPVSSA
jgi:hypothetical protein